MARSPRARPRARLSSTIRSGILPGLCAPAARVFSRTCARGLHAAEHDSSAFGLLWAASKQGYMRSTAPDMQRGATTATTVTLAPRRGAARPGAGNSPGRRAHVRPRTASRRGGSTKRNNSSVRRREGQAHRTTPALTCARRCLGGSSPGAYTAPERVLATPAALRTLVRPDPDESLLYRAGRCTRPRTWASSGPLAPWKVEEAAVRDGVAERAVAVAPEHDRGAIGRRVGRDALLSNHSFELGDTAYCACSPFSPPFHSASFFLSPFTSHVLPLLSALRS
jgi:hypothetical protein